MIQKTTNSSLYDIENTISEIYLSCCRREIAHLLISIDERLYEIVDTDIFRPRKKCEETLKTRFGAIRIARRSYKIGLKDGSSTIVFLLDEILGGKAVGQFTEAAAEIIYDYRSKGYSCLETQKLIAETCQLAVTRQGINNAYKGYLAQIKPFLKDNNKKAVKQDK